MQIDQMQARRILNGSLALTDSDGCAVCGGPAGTLKMSDVVSSNFTTWDAIRGDRSAPCCDPCETIFRDFRFRNTALLATGDGVSKIEQAAFLSLLSNPPADQYVLTWPSSRKKHCWLNAGVSDAASLRIGTDDRMIVVSPTGALTAAGMVERLYEAGATKAEAKIGMYRPIVTQRLGHEIEEIESSLKLLRASGALEIIVWCCERQQGSGMGDTAMLNDKDKEAAELIARLANGSGMRDSDPIGFWGRGLLSRVQRRTGARSLKVFVEALAADLSIRAASLADTIKWIESKPDEQQAQLLVNIKTSPRVLVAVAQDIAKGQRSDKKSGRAAIRTDHQDMINDKIGDLL